MSSISQTVGNDKNIYLDNAATTKPKRQVIDTITPYLTKKWYNPSSLYSEARQVSKDIASARENIGKIIGAKSDEVCFTSGGSESNCWAIQGFVNYWKSRGYLPHIVTTKIEHKSIIECVNSLESLGVSTYFVGVDKYGRINCEQLEKTLQSITENSLNKILVSMQFANNEIGIIQYINKITRIAHKYSAYLHTDAVQVVGHLPIDVKILDVDMLSASAHKFGGIKGSGFLYIKNGIEINPLIYGSQNDSMRGGTENVIGIVGMSKALDLCNMSYEHRKQKGLIRDTFCNEIKKLGYNIQFNNLFDCTFSLPSIISLTIKERITAEALVYMLNSAHISISSGSACNSHSETPSYVLKAIGLSDDDAIRTIRISFDDSITINDIEKFVSELDKAIRVLIG